MGYGAGEKKMDFTLAFYLVSGVAIGFCFGFVVHAFFIKWYIRKNMYKHPEYKIFKDVIEGSIPEPEKEEKNRK